MLGRSRTSPARHRVGGMATRPPWWAARSTSLAATRAPTCVSTTCISSTLVRHPAIATRLCTHHCRYDRALPHLAILVCRYIDEMHWITPLVGGAAPWERSGHTASVIGGRVFIFGGFSYAGGEWLNDTHIFNTGNAPSPPSLAWLHDINSSSRVLYRESQVAARNHDRCAALGSELPHRVCRGQANIHLRWLRQQRLAQRHAHI
jgi:hypothetical protein